MLYQFLISFIQILIQFLKKFSRTTHPPILQIKQETQFDKSCKRYAEFYSQVTEDENSNINPVLYQFDDRKELFADPANEQEKQWKSRILQENTPRGNVIMHYNPYTHTFVYYSDEQIIPYNILEQVAKKYVVMYRCKDFFVDIANRPDNKMIDVLQKEEDSLKSKKMKVNDITKCVNSVASDSKNVFASLKEYRTTPAAPAQQSTPSVPSSTIIAKKVSAEAKFANKFVRIGKMCEFNFLQKPPNKKIEAVNELMFGKTTVNKVIDFFDDEDCDNLEIREEEVTKIFSYKMFKDQMKS
jgi:hypothetical protein